MADNGSYRKLTRYDVRQMTRSTTFTKEMAFFRIIEGGLARFSCGVLLEVFVTSYQAYCMKCKNTVVVRSAKKIVMSNGRTRISGLCSRENCDGKLSKIIS